MTSVEEKSLDMVIPPSEGNNGAVEESTANNDINKLISSLPTRWEIELEFVQSLSNIQYLNFLAQNNYLQDVNFINYLNYLQYWNQPQYSKYLVYPNCLHILTLLQDKKFRSNIVNPEFMNNLMNDMVKRWQDPEAGSLTPPSAIPTNNGNGNGTITESSNSHLPSIASNSNTVANDIKENSINEEDETLEEKA